MTAVANYPNLTATFQAAAVVRRVDHARIGVNVSVSASTANKYVVNRAVSVRWGTSDPVHIAHSVEVSASDAANAVPLSRTSFIGAVRERLSTIDTGKGMLYALAEFSSASAVVSDKAQEIWVVKCVEPLGSTAPLSATLQFLDSYGKFVGPDPSANPPTVLRILPGIPGQWLSSGQETSTMNVDSAVLGIADGHPKSSSVMSKLFRWIRQLMSTLWAFIKKWWPLILLIICIFFPAVIPFLMECLVAVGEWLSVAAGWIAEGWGAIAAFAAEYGWGTTALIGLGAISAISPDTGRAIVENIGEVLGTVAEVGAEVIGTGLNALVSQPIVLAALCLGAFFLLRRKPDDAQGAIVGVERSKDDNRAVE